MFTLESPAQILTAAEWRARKARDQAGGTLEAPTTLYLTNAGTTLGPALILEAPGTLEERTQAARMAAAIIRGDESHRNGCGSGTFRVWERATCGTCALLGWREPRDHVEWPPGRPNYAGWARVYVQAREPIPREWLPAFLEALNDEENARYRDALRGDVAAYGYRVTDERPGYRLPTPSSARMLAFLRDYHGADELEAIREAAATVIEDQAADYPAGPYTAADVRAARQALELLEV